MADSGEPLRREIAFELLDWLLHLDTRSKILGAQEARRELKDKAVCWISGHFDPLLAEHVRRIRACARPGKLLAVEITEPLRPLLAQRARAELVAALHTVDYVVLSDQPPSDECADAAITANFIEHVLSRHRKEKAG